MRKRAPFWGIVQLPATRPWTAQESIGEPAARLAPARPIRRESGRRTLKSTGHEYVQTRWKLWGRVAGLQWIRLEPVGCGRAGERTFGRGRETGKPSAVAKCVVDRKGVQGTRLVRLERRAERRRGSGTNEWIDRSGAFG